MYAWLRVRRRGRCDLVPPGSTSRVGSLQLCRDGARWRGLICSSSGVAA